MRLNIPLDFIRRRVRLTWRDVEYGMENGWLSDDATVDLAIDRVSSENTPSPDAIELASVLPHEKYRIPEILHRLAKEESGLSKGKWLFLLLSWLYEHRDDFEDPFGIVEEVYADFDYPREIESFVRYMPAQDPAQTGDLHMLKAWLRYVQSAGSTYEPNV